LCSNKASLDPCGESAMLVHNKTTLPGGTLVRFKFENLKIVKSITPAKHHSSIFVDPDADPHMNPYKDPVMEN
jgi:hypothetical protein